MGKLRMVVVTNQGAVLTPIITPTQQDIGPLDFALRRGLIGVSNVHVHRSSMTPIETYITVVLDDWAKSQNPCPTREDRPVGNDWRWSLRKNDLATELDGDAAYG